MTVSIILTTTVNVNLNKSHIFQKDKNVRLNVYLQSILQWLAKTNFNIILVENSGYNYEELNKERELYKGRFEVITFKESELEEASYLKGDNSKGSSEIFAINYAFHNSKIIHASHFIIKITGRFFIPDLEEYLSNFDLNEYDSLTQNNRNRCEMVGTHYKNFDFIFNKNVIDNRNVYTYHIENIWRLRTSKCDNNLVCKEFGIEKTARGGVDQIYTTI
jgi:hypothetical protein